MKIKTFLRKKVQKSKIKSIKKVLQGSKIGLIDVGSSGGLEPRWEELSNNLSVFLFEPDERSYKELSKNSNDNWTVYPIALSSESKEMSLFLCRKPQVSSLYMPNRNFLDLFSNKERWDIVETATLTANYLDSVIAELPIREQCDFIKLDTQGSELSILEGSTEILDHLLGVEVEVEFVPLYENQPLFGDVNNFLDRHGFSFVDFTSLHKWRRNGFSSGEGQLVYANALFLKPPETVISTLQNQLRHQSDKAKSKLLRYIAICLLYQKTDYAKLAYDDYSKIFDIYLQPQDHNKIFSNDYPLKNWVRRSSKKN